MLVSIIIITIIIGSSCSSSTSSSTRIISFILLCSVMVINNRVHSTNITDKVFWYKAKPVPEFSVGSNKYVKYHKRSYDKEWDKRLAIFDPSSALAKKRNSLRLVVDKVK